MSSGEGSRPPSSDTTLSPESPFMTSPKSSYPLQAAETVKSRRRSSTAAAASAATGAKDPFALPPPPTRSRKIIQMKPRAQDDSPPEPAAAAKGAAGQAKATAAAAATPSTASATTSAPAAKKKQPSATSAAGRKIARKTAHSLIERRRRSKMNEEFGVLKGMIPACTGEMHKLAILQVSWTWQTHMLSYPPTPTDCPRLQLNTSGISRTALRSSRPSERAILHPQLKADCRPRPGERPTTQNTSTTRTGTNSHPMWR